MPAGERLSWFRWNPRDYLSDPAVCAMSFEERGRYMHLLMTLYLNNTGVATEDSIRVWAGYSEVEWPEHRESFARAFRLRRGGKWTQRRVELEVRAARRRVKTASESGRAGASKRWSSVTMPQRAHGEAKATR